MNQLVPVSGYESGSSTPNKRAKSDTSVSLGALWQGFVAADEVIK